MAAGPATLQEQFAAALDSWRPLSRLVVAFSGGVDSTALLLLASQARSDTMPVQALHINHQQADEAQHWQQQCQTVAARLDVELITHRVEVDLSTGGYEQACRDARYDAFQHHLSAGDVLLTAHHAQDQAETVLLNLMRGSGPRGLTGIPAMRSLGAGRIARPLLAVPKSSLTALVEHAQLPSIEDPSNRDLAAPRNYLRHQVLPLLRECWPGADVAINRSARLIAQNEALLGERTQAILLPLLDNEQSIDVVALQSHSTSWQAQALRQWLTTQKLPMPSERKLRDLLDQLDAADDAQPCVTWSGCEVRRFQHRLYAMSPLPPAATDWSAQWKNGELLLPAGCGRLAWLNPNAGKPSLTVSFRRGGERIKPAGDSHTRRLKALLQEARVPPWERDRMPLLWLNEQLAAVGDRWQTAEFGELLRATQQELHWIRC